jgi:TadE-like protein
MRPLAHESVGKSRSTAPSGHGSVPTVQQNQNVTRRSEAGSALIEFAGSLILLAVMFAGIFEIGYSFYAYGTLVTAVRAGARYAALQPRGAGVDPTVATAVRNLVVYGDPAQADRSKPVVAGLTTEHVELISGPDASTVSLRGFEVDALFMKVKLEGRPTVTFPVTSRGSQ